MLSLTEKLDVTTMQAVYHPEAGSPPILKPEDTRKYVFTMKKNSLYTPATVTVREVSLHPNKQ